MIVHWNTTLNNQPMHLSCLPCAYLLHGSWWKPFWSWNPLLMSTMYVCILSLSTTWTLELVYICKTNIHRCFLAELTINRYQTFDGICTSREQDQFMSSLWVKLKHIHLSNTHVMTYVWNVYSNIYGQVHDKNKVLRSTQIARNWSCLDIVASQMESHSGWSCCPWLFHLNLDDWLPHKLYIMSSRGLWSPLVLDMASRHNSCD